jgi:hypothetical protein
VRKFKYPWIPFAGGPASRFWETYLGCTHCYMRARRRKFARTDRMATVGRIPPIHLAQANDPAWRLYRPPTITARRAKSLASVAEVVESVARPLRGQCM